MSPRPGEVWLADLGPAAKTRPVVIVSRHDPNPPRALVLYVPLTTQHRLSPYMRSRSQGFHFSTVTRSRTCKG
ncbi:MAG: type II toxin-antitoxin system PemK/MazF family toxin [Bryobacteraceae bacterium]